MGGKTTDFVPIQLSGKGRLSTIVFLRCQSDPEITVVLRRYGPEMAGEEKKERKKKT